MGNEITPSTPLNLLTDRSLSFNSNLPSDRSNCPEKKSTKTIRVGSIDELQILRQNFNFRLKNKQYLTHCYGFQVVNLDQNNLLKNFGCTSPFLTIEILFYYQKVTQKFSDLYHVPIDQGSRLLAHCLNGFSILYDKFGYFPPESRLVQKQGQQWKVWISDNIFAIKSRNSQKNQLTQVSRAKFLQQVVHLFDALRDPQYPEFSYTDFLYGKMNTQNTQYLQLSQILQRLQQTFKIKTVDNRLKQSLRRQSASSNQTVRKAQCNTLISFEDKTNEATLPKFKNKDSIHKNGNKSMSLYNPSSSKFKENQKETIQNSKILSKNASFSRQRQSSIHEHFQPMQSTHSKGFSQFKRVSSKLIQEPVQNQLLNCRQNQCIKHYKGRSSVSTPSNCTGCTKQIFPLNMLASKIRQGCNNCSNKFYKKQRSFTMDLSYQANQGQQAQQIQPRKITENSEVNSDSQENLAKVNNNFNQAFAQSSLQLQDSKQGSQLQPIQVVTKKSTSNTPSIAHKTKKYGKQTMKFLKEYLMTNSKGEHKRSLTDHTGAIGDANRIKFCWSQEFDSQFFSIQSKMENPIPSKLEINEEDSEEKHSENVPQPEKSSKQELSDKKIKRVKIAENECAKEYSYRKSDFICEKSVLDDQDHESKEASIAKLPIFKSEGGLKSLLTNKLSTLKSIKQIQVQVPIDEEILNDLNKMFTKHRFAKSSKLTK